MSLSEFNTNEQLAKIMEQDGVRLAEIQNPITRSIVRINPPLKCTDPDALKAFERYFGMWCEALWMLGYIDPDEITSPRGLWLADDAHTAFLKSATQE